MLQICIYLVNRWSSWVFFLALWIIENWWKFENSLCLVERSSRLGEWLRNDKNFKKLCSYIDDKLLINHLYIISTNNFKSFLQIIYKLFLQIISINYFYYLFTHKNITSILFSLAFMPLYIHSICNYNLGFGYNKRNTTTHIGRERYYIVTKLMHLSRRKQQ